MESGFPAVRESHYPQAMYDAQMAYFADCIRANRTPVPGGAEGWSNMQIVDAAYESSRTGAVVGIGDKGPNSPSPRFPQPASAPLAGGKE